MTRLDTVVRSDKSLLSHVLEGFIFHLLHIIMIIHTTELQRRYEPLVVDGRLSRGPDSRRRMKVHETDAMKERMEEIARSFEDLYKYIRASDSDTKLSIFLIWLTNYVEYLIQSTAADLYEISVIVYNLLTLHELVS